VRDPGGDLVFLLGTTGVGTGNVQRSLALADRVLLPATFDLSNGDGIPTAYGGTGEYLPDDVILDAVELGIIKARIADYNNVISTEAQNAGAAFVDAFTRTNDVHANGVLLGGLLFTTDFLSGGLFGYDGLHPTNLGYGVVTQWFVDAINETYGGSIPPVDLGPMVFDVVQPPASLFDVIFGSAAVETMMGAMGVPTNEEIEEIWRQRLDDRMSPHRRSHGGRRDVLERRTRER
jgi:hypothetical protein